MRINMRKIEKYINEELDAKGGLLFSLIDPDDYDTLDKAVNTAKLSCEGGADVILMGGSISAQGEMLDKAAKQIKENINVPLILFPGNIATITKYADAIYFMSLLNSRNPYWISHAQTLAAPVIKHSGIEPLPLGYIVVEPGGTVGWVGDVNLIPRHKPKIAAALAMGAEYTGNRFILTDAGSNPSTGHIPLEMVRTVSKSINVPYIVAGGIKTAESAGDIIKAGADIIQVGTALENSDDVKNKVKKMVNAVREAAKSKK